jgi:hypothetical protein
VLGKETAQNGVRQSRRATAQGSGADGAIGLDGTAEFIGPSQEGRVRIIQVAGGCAKALRKRRAQSFRPTLPHPRTDPITDRDGLLVGRIFVPGNRPSG